MNTGEKVKEYRLRNAWSQEQLAELASLSVRTVQRIEKGHKPGLETLSALASVFNVEVAELSVNRCQSNDIYVIQRFIFKIYRSTVTRNINCYQAF